MLSQLEAAYVLHSRPFRETSMLLNVFTENHGIVSLVARGARSNKSKLKSLLQPFIPLKISYKGKTELMNLTDAETLARFIRLKSNALLSAFYLNELLINLLQKMDPHKNLFNIYAQTLLNLSSDKNLQQSLRIFEKKLLNELGYGLDLKIDYETGLPIIKENSYYFHPDQGFTLDNSHSEKSYKGEILLALKSEENISDDFLKPLKYLMRAALLPHLGTKELKTRELFKR